MALRASERALREKTEELKRKNEVLEDTLKQLHEAQSQLIIQEKMASLGKLSAGMAHELNNPAAAVQRGADYLRAAFGRWQGIELMTADLKLDSAQIQRVRALDQVARDRARRPADVGALTRSDREVELERWLEERDIDTGGQLAPVLVGLGYGPSDLEGLAEGFSSREFEVVINRLAFAYDLHLLVAEISLGTGRIVELVNALKTYTHLDRAPAQAVDVREGLDNTLIILHNKLKKGVTVVREYAEDLPPIEAHAGEINQVWTNIIDNAIDAMGGEGRLTIRARREDPWMVIEIEDDGPGIPLGLCSKIFDLFFTAKAPGQGTGLGLNISRTIVVQKHHGDISVKSKPGSTSFTVRLPIASS